VGQNREELPSRNQTNDAKPITGESGRDQFRKNYGNLTGQKEAVTKTGSLELYQQQNGEPLSVLLYGPLRKVGRKKGIKDLKASVTKGLNPKTGRTGDPTPKLPRTSPMSHGKRGGKKHYQRTGHQIREKWQSPKITGAGEKRGKWLWAREGHKK